MKGIAVFLGLFLCLQLNAQSKINLEDVSRHIGDTVKVEGIVSGVKLFDNPESPILVNIGGEFPNQKLTVVVYRSSKTENTELPNEQFKGYIAIVTGRLEMYKGKPQIVVREPNKLFFAIADAVTVPKDQ